MMDYKFRRVQDEEGQYHIAVHGGGKLIASIPCYHNRNIIPQEYSKCLKHLENLHNIEITDGVKLITQFDVLTSYHKGLSFEKCEDIDDLLKNGYDVYLVTEDDCITVCDAIIYNHNPNAIFGEDLGQLLSGTKESYIEFCYNDKQIKEL